MGFKKEMEAPHELVAANVSSLICFCQKIRADSRRLLRIFVASNISWIILSRSLPSLFCLLPFSIWPVS
jgi:hypothetical protein